MGDENLRNNNNNISNVILPQGFEKGGVCVILSLPCEDKEIISDRPSMQVKHIKFK